MRRSAARHEADYQSLIKPLGGSLPTVEAFAAVYLHVHRPTQLPPGTDLFVFRSGVQPMWEDAANSAGGRLTVRLRKAASAVAFEETVLRLVGGTLQPRGSLCGVSVSVRPSHDVLALWLNTSDENVISRCRLAASKDLPGTSASSHWEFKRHIQDGA